MAVAGVRVDDRYHPVLGHFAGNAENAVVTGLYVLADHGGQQLCGLGDDLFALLRFPIEDQEQAQAVGIGRQAERF